MRSHRRFHTFHFLLIAVLLAIGGAAGAQDKSLLHDEGPLIRETLHKYAMFIDDRRIDAWLDLFVEDAHYHVIGQTHVGHQEILANVLGDPDSESTLTHTPFPAIIKMLSKDEALAWADFFVVRRHREGEYPAHSIKYMGRYHDKLTKSKDGRWRFVTRSVYVNGMENSGDFLQPPD